MDTIINYISIGANFILTAFLVASTINIHNLEKARIKREKEERLKMDKYYLVEMKGCVFALKRDFKSLSERAKSHNRQLLNYRNLNWGKAPVTILNRIMGVNDFIEHYYENTHCGLEDEILDELEEIKKSIEEELILRNK